MERERNLIMANTFGYEEVYVEEKPTLSERAAEFVVNHPVLTNTVALVVCVVITVPLCAFYGNRIGKAAGKSAAKTLLEAGVRL